MRVCLFGTYNRGHSANRIYADAVRASGCELVEIHEALWEKTRDKDRAYFSPGGLFASGAGWLAAAWRLWRRWQSSGGAPVVLIGFNGQLDILLLRAIAPRHGPRIVFAPLVTLTETLVDDRGQYRRGSIGQRLLTWLDRLTLRAADVVVADTYAHRTYMIDRLGADPARVAVCHLGVDNSAFSMPPAQAQPRAGDRADASAKIEIIYFGQYLPLHGLDVVVDALTTLATRGDLRFVFIGSGQGREPLERHIRATRAEVEFIDWVPYEELGRRVARADIALGTFGSSAKAKMVIANKIYEAAAVGTAVVTADTPAVGEVFTDDDSIVLCPATARGLAAAITRLADDPELRRRLAKRGRELMSERFGAAAQGRAWGALLAADAARVGGERVPSVGVAVLNFNDTEATLRCLASLAHCEYPNMRVLVVDNGSHAQRRRALEDAIAERFDAAATLLLDENRGYAGGNNAAMDRLFAEGCDHVVLLNDDTVVTPDAIDAMVACAEACPEAGPIGPRVAAEWPGAAAASLGERYWPMLAWLPRTLLRYRRARQRAYRVGGLMGCALLVTRRLYERLGGFEESFFAYYEEVDYCLRARACGMAPRVEPAAEIAHTGHRGFGSGMNPVAAYLKARNLWVLGRKRLGAAAMTVFAAGYSAMIVASAAAYLLRGRSDIVRAMCSGVRAGLRAETGPPPSWIVSRSPSS